MRASIRSLGSLTQIWSIDADSLCVVLLKSLQSRSCTSKLGAAHDLLDYN